MRAFVRLLLCAVCVVVVGLLVSCNQNKRDHNPNLRLPQGCRVPDDGMYSRTPVYTTIGDKTVLVGFTHYYDVDQAASDENREKADPKMPPICLLEPTAQGPDFRGDTIIWQSRQHLFTVSFLTNSAGCSTDRPFKNMPSSSAMETQVASIPTGNGSGPPAPSVCEYNLTFKGDQNNVIGDPHLRLGK